VFLLIYGILKTKGDTSNVRLQALGFIGIILVGLSITTNCSIIIFHKYKMIRKIKM
jgi:hypothetical protein